MDLNDLEIYFAVSIWELVSWSLSKPTLWVLKVQYSHLFLFSSLPSYMALSTLEYFLSSNLKPSTTELGNVRIVKIRYLWGITLKITKVNLNPPEIYNPFLTHPTPVTSVDFTCSYVGFHCLTLSKSKFTESLVYNQIQSTPIFSKI